VEHLDVLIVGAGLSGIGAAYHVQTDCPWAEYAVFEARDDLGGTWDLFRYPGIRSDSDMFTFSYPFRPWDKDRSIGEGADILQYLRDTAAEFGIDRRIRFGHRIIAADWSGEDGFWNVTAERTDGDGRVTRVELTCSFLFSCSGYYRYDRGHLPDFPGMDDFGGTLVHPQQWPQDLDVDGTRIVVIGSGATAITLVPSLAARGAHVTMLQRSPTYIASLPGTNPVTRLIRRCFPRRWQGTALRWSNALATQASYKLSKRHPGLVKRVLRKGIERELPPGYDIDTHFTPRYDPWDQRLCVVPDGDLFRAIRSGDVDVVTDRIETFTPTGLRLESGTELDADIIVTATGLELLFLGGIELTVDGEEVEPGERLAYKGMMLEGVPNAAMAVGYTNASWTLKSELTADYVARLLNHMRRIGAVQCVPVNDDPTIERSPLLGLTAGYVTRAQDRFPQQGSRFPWQMHQSYVADHRIMKRGGLADDGALVFSRPSPRTARTASPTHEEQPA
jgi:cation diffusion facilitator CzcD-associated flavoprotein CzcO